MAWVYLVELDGEPIYVGKTVQTVHRRWRQHVRAAYTVLATRLERLIAERGFEAFVVTAIEHHDTDEQAKASEVYWIARLRDVGHPLLNETLGGDGTLGHRFVRGPHDEIHKLKIANALVGHVAPNRKLTEDDVRYIRTSSESCLALGRRFNVGGSTIHRIRKLVCYAQ